MAAVAGELSTAELSGLFKEVYGDRLIDPRPKSLKVMNDVPFVPQKQRPGNTFHQPVLLQHEHGFTYAGADAGAFALNATIAGQMKDATIIGNQKLLRSRMDYESAARATEGGKGAAGKRSFYNATRLLVEEMATSFQKNGEINLINGQQGLAEVLSISTNDITIKVGFWAPGIWAGAEGAKIEAFSDRTDSATARVGAAMKITAVNMETRVISVDAAQAAIVAGDVLYYADSRTATTFEIPLGIHDILAAPTTLFGIATASFSLWKPSTFGVGSAELTFGKVNKAVVGPVSKGLEEDLCLYLAINAWADLLDNEVAQRRWNNTRGRYRYDVGGEEITFYSQSGKIQIKASLYIQESFAYLLAPKNWKRVGSTPMTFQLPGRGDEFFLHLDDNAGFELRCYENCSPFCDSPGRTSLLTGIVNGT